MGVKSLWEILGPTARPVRLEALSRKKLAVDASIWIYQFLKAVRDSEGNALPQSHIVGFFRRICKLLYFGIYPIFVFDGGAPLLKRQTILQRKQRREGHTETTRQTAQKLLAIHVQRQAQQYHASKASHSDDGDGVFLEDLPIAHPMHGERAPQQSHAPPTSTRFVKNDEYHLPTIEKFRVSTSDSRIMPEDEFQESLAEFDYVDGIDINSVDPNSKEFLQLPIGTQYMVLSHLRLKSRLRMGYRKDQLEALFPDSMDFSKFQIQQVQKRNFYTQKLMNVAGMGDDGNATRRIAGDKDRKYALIKNDDGWTLSIDGDSSEKNPIVLDEDGNEVKNPFVPVKDELKQTLQNQPGSDDDSDEFEDVDLDVQETEQEKEQQKALIESIYSQYETANPGVPTVDGFHEDDLRRAIENSKKDLELLYRQEAELDTKISEQQGLDPQNNSSGGLGRSFLFATGSKIPSVNKQKPQVVNGPGEKSLAASESLGSSFLFGGPTVQKPSLPDSSTAVPIVPQPQSRIVEDTESRPRREATVTSEGPGFVSEDSKSGAEVIEVEPESPEVVTRIDSGDQSSANEINVPVNVHEKGQNDNIKVQIDLDKKDHESEQNENSNKEITKIKNQPIPSWFNEGLSELNVHQQTSFGEAKDTREQFVEDEHAGLIPWNEAREMFLGAKQDYVNELSDGVSDEDDIQEIAPPEAQRAQDIDAKEPREPLREAEARKAQIIEYDFEDDDGDELLHQLREEEDGHENFKSTIQKSLEVPLATINSSITQEQMLQEKLNKEKRDSEEVTQTMISDVQELLRRFGIPYITAPMEAEAQCAELFKLNLVDGIITDDSDSFLFGGDKVYKNMFNQKQYVECYISEEIEQKVGLTQDKLIELALLLGSDYTEGIKGVGPVLAMEILAEFGTLKDFKKWYDQQTTSLTTKNTETGLKKTLLARIRAGKLFLPDSFPDLVVFTAYKSPEVDHDKSPFKWGVPSLDQIRSYLMYNVNWPQERVDEVMVPLIRDMNRKKQEGTQSTISEFFPQEYIQSRKELSLGKRIKTAANKLNKRAKTTS
ncbi:PIN domain-like protein [Suhomyces tanzawaensis NRRL Y-17324]|uniref:PIN domain-like protein n=1 Tax=Suhomyces tanzawaensis NRRL Y-17324 TaxID=984487 RepID=A0A1E4SMA0_9ASCO|nr:PIN domain-like protein [Suhomyces tanzawaensis NRRL Y-17324]ODV80656.1 PIN domain-like protein [Suhomyces tanzawaensis NRRL Y-17324]